MSSRNELTSALRAWVRSCSLRTQREWRRNFATLGLSMSQIGVLGMLCHHQGVFGIREIGERLRVSSAAASQLVDRLAQAGFVERAVDPMDRRTRRISITDRGRSLFEGRLNDTPRWIKELATALSDDEQTVVMEALSILNRLESGLDDALRDGSCAHPGPRRPTEPLG